MRHLKQCLGVDLGFHTVKIVELALDRNGVRTVRAATAQTGAAPGMSTEEINQAIISTARELLKKGRFSSRKAIYAISGQKVFVRRFRLPRTSEERLQRIIQYEARQQIPFPLEKTILQYQHRDLPEEGEVEVLLVAIRSDEVRNFMSVVNRIGLKPLAIGVSSFALFNSHHFIGLDEKLARKRIEALSKKKKAGAEAAKGAAEAADEEEQDVGAYEEVKGLINLGATSYDLAIGRLSDQEGSVGFIRTVPTGGNEMSRAIQKLLKVDTFNDSERIKVSSTQLKTFAFDLEEEGQVNEEASQAVTEVMDRIVAEIRRSLDFFITQPDGMAIDAVALSGGQALMPGIEAYLEEKLTVPVTVVREPPEGSVFRWQENAGPLTSYMIAVGLALQGMGLASISVDFLPEEQKITRDFPYRVAAVMFFLVAGIVGISSQAGQEFAEKYRRQASSLESELSRKRQQTREYSEAQQVHDEVAEKFLAFDKSFGQRDFWMNLVVDLAAAKPAGVLLRDVDMSHDGRVTIVGESTVQVDAADFNEQIKEVFADRLRDDSTIENVIPTTPPGGGETVFQFTIRFRLKDKINHLKITPTPSPTPVGGGIFGQQRRPGMPQPGRGGPLF